MKRLSFTAFTFLCVISFLLCFTSCSRVNKENEPEGSPLSNAAEGDLPGEPLNLISLKKLFKIESVTDSEGNICKVVQGGCAYDGFAYIALNDGNSQSTDSVSAINKYDLNTGELVKSYQGLRISHCNDMTVNRNTGELITVHNTPDLTNISIFDLETMEYKETRTLTPEIYGIVYDPYEECYWVGISRSYNYAKLDLNFNVMGDIIEGEVHGGTRQGIEADSKHVYFLRYKDNRVIMYDKKANTPSIYRLSVAESEPECIFFDGENLYIAYYTGNGGFFYKADLYTQETLKAEAKTTSISLIDAYSDSEGNVYSVPQGSCTDGKHIYVILSNNEKQNYRSALAKIDIETLELVSVTPGLDVGLSNDLTYNTKTGEIIIVHNSPNADKVTFIDADTMETTREATLDLDIYALAYNSAEDCYYAGLSGGYDFVKLDENLTQVSLPYSGYPIGYTRQGMDCDGRYVYFALADKNSVAIYRADGTLVNIVTLPATYGSIQSICHTKNSFYVTYSLPKGGAEIYELEMSIGK